MTTLDLNYLTREQAISLVSPEVIDAVDRKNCDYTNRVTDDDTDEFAACIDAKLLIPDQWGDEVVVTVYYYQDREDTDGCEDWGLLTWEPDHYAVL